MTQPQQPQPAGPANRRPLLRDVAMLLAGCPIVFAVLSELPDAAGRYVAGRPFRPGWYRLVPDDCAETKAEAGRQFIDSAREDVDYCDRCIAGLEAALQSCDSRIQSWEAEVEAHCERYPNGVDSSGGRSAREVAEERLRLETRLETERRLRHERQQHLDELRAARARASDRIAEMEVESARLAKAADRAYRERPDSRMNDAVTLFSRP
jgi:hypothetical protein